MVHPVRRLLLACLCLAGLVSWARAVYPPPLRDEGKFFKEETINQANKKIRALYQKYKRDVVVETYPSIPPDIEKRFENKDRKELFAVWGRERAEQLGLNGVYLLLSRKPGYLQIEVDAQTHERAFRSADRNKLRDLMLEKLKARDPDGALLEGLTQIESAFKANLK